MASMPHTHFVDYPDLYQDFPGAGHQWNTPFPFFDHYAGLPESDVPMMSSFQPERHDYAGAVDMAVPVLPADLNMQSLCGSVQGIGGAGLREFVSDHYCFGFGNDGFKEDNNYWRNQLQKTSSVEESNTKVGRYSAEERKDRILRYLKKRNQRNFNKTIKYVCRKTLADRRVRVRGRFARNNELSEEENIIKKNLINVVTDDKETEFFSGEGIQVKHDGEDWLQEAMASLLYLPYV